MSRSQTFGAHSGQSPLEWPGSAGTWNQVMHGARGAGPGRAEGTARRAGVPEAQRGVIASGRMQVQAGANQTEGRCRAHSPGQREDLSPCEGTSK